MRKTMVLSAMVMLLFSLNAGAATMWVDIIDVTSAFNPYNLYVPVGTTVVWTNYDALHHTATADSGAFSSPILLTGQSFSFTFTTVGVYSYHCTVHPMMMGVINVVASALAMPMAVTLAPTGGPVVIPPGGGSFQYHVTGHNQSGVTQNITFFTKEYKPDNTAPLYTLSKPGLIMPPNATKGTNVNQNVPGTFPAGIYHFVGSTGSNPDTIKGWASFDFTKSAVTDFAGDWSGVMLTEWADEQPGNPVTAPSTQSNAMHLRNYPEPFNPSTTISFSLPTDGAVSLEIFNLSGARVSTLINGYRSAGEHQVTFDGSNLPSGLYLYSLTYGGQTLTSKMMLVK